MRVGVIVWLNEEIKNSFEKLRKMGIDNCQLNCWDMSMFTDEMAQEVKSASAEFSIDITALWCGWSGPACWDYYDGPSTLGVVPECYRAQRCNDLKNGSDFAKKIGVTDIITHAGYMPENPSTYEYTQLIVSLRDVVAYVNRNGQNFLFETGQETPTTLKRVIQDIKLDNIGINLDPANLIIYGKGNPIDALDVFGELVKGVHGKDAVYSNDGHQLGREVKMGEGRVNYPLFIKRLKEVGYDGAITIEREIDGEKQIEDIRYAKQLLEELIGRED